MKPFEVVEPATVSEAVALLDPEDASVRALGGGTALMLMMKARLFQPTRLVSLRRLDGVMRTLSADEEGGLHLGACLTLSELEQSRLVAHAVPVISRTLRKIANVRIRNLATLGGHLSHGDPHMDLPPVLLTLGARVRAVSPRGERWIDLANFFSGYYQTALAGDELMVELVVDPQPQGVCAWYEKFTALNADDWPAVGVAVRCQVDSGAIVAARIAVSAATERPLRLAGAEGAALGAPATADTFAKIAGVACAEVEPLADIRGSASYKRDMIRVHVRRAFEYALHPNAPKAGTPGTPV